MKIERLQVLPDWPGRMTASVAALYMGVSQTTFLSRFGAMAVREGGNTLWARAQLDRHIEKQFGLPQLGPATSERDTSWDDLR